jgi:hypothetical protein
VKVLPLPSFPVAFRPGLALVAVVAALAWPGCPPSASAPCSDDADCPDGRCRFGACGPLCEEDLDCGSRQLCRDGACVPRPECQRDTDCAGGFRCAQGSCLCTSDQACALNQSCVAGVCQGRASCRSAQDCPSSQRCELTSGLCIAPCIFATDCAPGLDPRLALLLYSCRAGDCLRACAGDVTCGPDLICHDGFCEVPQCHSLADCPTGQYCTSATAGRCEPYRVCGSDADCGPNQRCQGFEEGSCPPGFPCAQRICQPLPRCLTDEECEGYCQGGHCRSAPPCTEGEEGCGEGRVCVALLCVPGGCRGHADCLAEEACVGGLCREEPLALNLQQLYLTPQRLRLVVGQSAELKLVGLEVGGGSFPSLTAAWQALDATGQASTVVTVSAEGVVTAMAPGWARLEASVSGSLAPPVEAVVDVLPALGGGRRVSVVEAHTLAPLQGAAVQGCDDAPADVACPAPVTVLTDALGVAHFPSFIAPRASFSVGAPELRADGRPRYELFSIVATSAPDLLVPLAPNPVAAAAGFGAVLSFGQVKSEGNYWLGLAAQSAGDPSEVDLQQLLGETFFVTLPSLPAPVPVPGSVVLYDSPGFGIPREIKGRAFGLGQPGRRSAVAFAGRTTSAGALAVRTTDLLTLAGAFEQALLPFVPIHMHPRVPDELDLDGDGRCSDPARCPLGPEDLPDYFAFPQLSFTPRFEQQVRTEIVVSEIPAEFDTVVYATVQAAGESGVLAHGLSSRQAGVPTGAVRPVEATVVRSGAPRDGTEVGLPGTWVMAVQAGPSAAGTGAESGRLSRHLVLPTRVLVPPLLPTAQGSTFWASTRTFAPAQPAWNALVSQGGELVRLDVVGDQVRHRVYFGAHGSQTQVRVPQAPQIGVEDPVGDPRASVRVTVLDLAWGLTADDALGLPGPNLAAPALLIDGYSRWLTQ